MSDERLRELQRRWRETGSVEVEALYLQERVRSGGLRKDRLLLAAYSGHEGARLAADGEAPPTIHSIRDFGRLFDWGMDVAVRAATAACELIRFSGVPAVDEAARRATRAVQKWCDCPCRRHAQEAELAADAVAEAADPSFEDALGGFAGVTAVTELAQMPGDVERLQAGELERGKVTSYLVVREDGAATIWEELLSSGLTERMLVVAACTALVNWALSSGEFDASGQ